MLTSAITRQSHVRGDTVNCRPGPVRAHDADIADRDQPTPRQAN
jgi:hypothetical protein